MNFRFAPKHAIGSRSEQKFFDKVVLSLLAAWVSSLGLFVWVAFGPGGVFK